MSIENVKKLRDMTGAGFLDVKKALEATNNDLEKAVEWLRKNGIAKAAKKADSIAADGIVMAKIDSTNTIGAIIEINSQTDFVAKNAEFISFAEKVLNEILNLKDDQDMNPDVLKKEMLIDGISIEEHEINLTAKIGEKISVRRFTKIASSHVEIYNHINSKVSVLIGYENLDKVVAKDICMHAAAMAPKFKSLNDVPENVKTKEVEILKDQYKKEFASIPEKLSKLDFIVAGALKKQIAELVLEEQQFVKNPSKKIKDLLSSGKLNYYIRFEVGEGIEKPESNFADEVRKAVEN